MSNKKTSEINLLIPGEVGWEIWHGSPEKGFSLKEATQVTHASELDHIPSGDITLLFPVKSITAIPMRVASTDEALFEDLAGLHAERLGLRPDPMAGQLTDQFVISQDPENTALLSVLLRVPEDGDLPARGPKEFDVSARALPIDGDSIALWKEFGRWVFAFSYQGKLVYCQATSFTSASPEEELIRDIRLALIQLSLQGIELEPKEIRLWGNPEVVSAGALTGAFSASEVQISPRPTPHLPTPASKLLPADVRAARREAKRRQNIQLAVGAVALVYLCLIGWYAYGLWSDLSDTKRLTALAKEAEPEGKLYEDYVTRWDELAPAIEVQNIPVDILNRIANCAPANSGLKLRSADISAAEIKITGEAQQPAAINQFNLALHKSNDLANFEWQTPEPNQSNRGWEFTYTATNPAMTPNTQP
ncbi:PilN domain-containing protein [Luteolibacter pohnpeiensis]|uniref:PilN domain-containing protein n=1 Tax=Luteolibacter pohnpeiensis TaxID=454153 RepID=A0A934S6V9_9BACT|nr:PilN domain-containing protein [Luteolibacter pohnpeiensis]MBK1882943.1 PilN domain-containing protein [Luteolibacter pohnpeiensis]